jgi:hypothetical protein
MSQLGALAEWLRSGLQSRLHRFDSGRRLWPWQAVSSLPERFAADSAPRPKSGQVRLNPVVWVAQGGTEGGTRGRIAGTGQSLGLPRDALCLNGGRVAGKADDHHPLWALSKSANASLNKSKAELPVRGHMIGQPVRECMPTLSASPDLTNCVS